MEPLIVGALAGLTTVLGIAFWQLLVRPEPLLALWGRSDGWLETHPGPVRALRLVFALLLFVSGFLTGLALTFLTGTS
jgi:hypothetical protein